MIDPAQCNHPDEHYIAINGDLKYCELCGVKIAYKNNAWVVMPPQKKK